MLLDFGDEGILLDTVLCSQADCHIQAWIYYNPQQTLLQVSRTEMLRPD